MQNNYEFKVKCNSQCRQFIHRCQDGYSIPVTAADLNLKAAAAVVAAAAGDLANTVKMHAFQQAGLV